MTLKTESVPEMSVDLNNLIWLSTKENFTKIHSVILLCSNMAAVSAYI